MQKSFSTAYIFFTHKLVDIVFLKCDCYCKGFLNNGLKSLSLNVRWPNPKTIYLMFKKNPKSRVIKQVKL